MLLVGGAQMSEFVSSQTLALRDFAARSAGTDRFGFAWAPNNATAMPNAEFVTQTGQLLDRLGVTISASGAESVVEPTAPSGADIVGASFTDAWRIFSSWEDVRETVSRVHRQLAARVRALVTSSQGR